MSGVDCPTACPRRMPCRVPRRVPRRVPHDKPRRVPPRRRGGLPCGRGCPCRQSPERGSLCEMRGRDYRFRLGVWGGEPQRPTEAVDAEHANATTNSLKTQGFGQGSVGWVLFSYILTGYTCSWCVSVSVQRGFKVWQGRSESCCIGIGRVTCM